MILDIKADGTLRLVDADNCTAFHVSGARPSDTATAVDGLRFTDDLTHAFVAPALVESLAAGQVGADWSARFGAMLDYAAGKGWLDGEGHIQVHCEWDGAGATPA